MATYTLNGYALDFVVSQNFFNDSGLNVFESRSAAVELVLNTEDRLWINQDNRLFLYSAEVRLNDVIVEGLNAANFFAENWVWGEPEFGSAFTAGSAEVAIVYEALPSSEPGEFRYYVFGLNGDRLPNLVDSMLVLDFWRQLDRSDPVSETLRPDPAEFWRRLDINDLDHLTPEDDDRVAANNDSTRIELGAGADTVETGLGDDTVNTGDDHDLVIVTGPGTEGDDKYIDVGTGHDRIELPAPDPDPNADRLYVRLRHDDLTNGIQVTLDEAQNSLSIDKGSRGSTEVTNMVTALNGNGLAFIGTEFDDRFEVSLDSDDAWLVVGPNAGNDTLSVQGEVGTVWLAFDYAEATSGADINLQTGIVANDGTGGRDLITGQIDRMSGTILSDMFVGSDSAAINYTPMGGRCRAPRCAELLPL